MKAWLRKGCATWTPTAFTSACGSSSSPSKKSTPLSSCAVVENGCSIFAHSYAVVEIGRRCTACQQEAFRDQRCAGVVLLRDGMTHWKAHNSGGCLLNPGGVLGQIWVSVETQRYRTIPQRRLYGITSGFCASVEAFLSPGVTCAVCSAAWCLVLRWRPLFRLVRCFVL